MKKSRFTEEQIIGVLRKQEAGAATADVCRPARHLDGDVLQLESQPPFADAVSGHGMSDDTPSCGGRYHFFDATSFRIALSSICSASSRFSFEFSSSSARKRFASETSSEWVDWFNNRRLLEPIGNLPPAEAEAAYYAALEEPAKLAA